MKISEKNMLFLHTKHRSAVLRYLAIAAILFSIILGTNPTLASDIPSNQITGIATQETADGLIVRIQAKAEPTYTVYELFNPTRVVVDIADVSLADNLPKNLPKNSTASLSSSYLSGNDPILSRFEFTLKGSSTYTINQKDNDIIVALKESDSKQPQASAQHAKKTSNQKDGIASEINDIKITSTQSETKVLLLADGHIADYSYNVLDSQDGQPARLYVDLKGISGETLLREQQIGTAVDKIRIANRGSGLRIVLDSDKSEIFPFKILNKKDRLEVVIKEAVVKDAGKQQTEPKITPLASQKIPSKLPEIQKATSAIKDNFGFSGYNKQRITVDFFKIDLHNVFRLFKEISNINFVVDESVSGSLTLSLDNVPWDFALDIILNLKDLQKEERHNTIVILPKGKQFSWPEQTANNLSFEADEKVAEEEAIIIRQKQNLSPERIAAKKLIQQGREFEKKGEYDAAVKSYITGLNNWDDNSNLANRIATLFLVSLQQNAKAVYYAKKALKIDSNNSSAALNAAIALANMQKKKEAGQFFDQSVSGKKPTQAALQSYAVYCEDTKKYSAAIKLLKKHDTLYGETLGSMISLARIYDKKGDKQMSTQTYKSILLSGYRVPADLKQYIRGRIAIK